MPGLLGKLPCQADFLRVNATGPLTHALHRWLEEGHEGLLAAKARLPEGPTAFVFGAPGEKEVLIGVLVPSVDKVGRAFPCAVFRACEATLAARELSALPFAFEPFLRGAAELLAAAPMLGSGELSSRLAVLDGPIDFSRGHQLRAQALGGPAAPLSALLGVEEGPPYYAVRTFLSACEADRAAMPSSARVTLDCPVSPALPAGFWLELARRLLRWSAGPPSLLWSSSRLLISLGPSPGGALLFLANPDHPSSRLWPLRTQKAAAVLSAKQGLLPAQREALERPEASLEQLSLALAP